MQEGTGTGKGNAQLSSWNRPAALGAVTADQDLRDGAWSVAVALILLSDDAGVVRASLRAIAATCRRDRQTVRRALAQLVRSGALGVVPDGEQHRLFLRATPVAATPGGVGAYAQGVGAYAQGGWVPLPRGVGAIAQGVGAKAHGGKGGPMSTGHDLPETKTSPVDVRLSSSLSSDLSTSSQDLTRLSSERRQPKAKTSLRDLSTYGETSGGGKTESPVQGTVPSSSRTRSKKETRNPNQLTLPIEKIFPHTDDLVWAQQKLGWDLKRTQDLAARFTRSAREPRVLTEDAFSKRFREYVGRVAGNEPKTPTSGSEAPSRTRYASAEDRRLYGESLDLMNVPYDPSVPYVPQLEAK